MLIGFAIVLGVILTATPFFGLSDARAMEFFHWPLLLVDRHFNSLVPLNAGKRVITLFMVNVCVWAFVLGLTLFPLVAMRRKHN